VINTQGFGFPLAADDAGRISVSGGDELLRGKILQVLFTAPGERVHRPEFGCGLFNLVFEPNDKILATAMEFTINQSLVRWLESEIRVDGVSVSDEEEMILVEIAYTRLMDRSTQGMRIRFR